MSAGLPFWCDARPHPTRDRNGCGTFGGRQTPNLHEIDKPCKSDYPQPDYFSTGNRSAQGVQLLAIGMIADLIDKRLKKFNPRIEFNKLLASKKVLLFETSGSHHFQRFQKIYVLLKLLASNPNTKTIVLISHAEAVFPNMKNISPAIQYLMTQLHRRNVSLHLSIRNPSLLNNVVLSFFKNIVALRISEDKDVQTTANLLMLKESSEGYYSSQRHSLQQISYLKTLSEERAILLRDDVVSAFPIILDTVPIIEVSDALIEDVFKVSVPSHSVVTSKSLLEIEFGNDAKFAWSLLNWLNRTPLTMTALTNIFDNVSPEKLFAIVKRMQELNLIKPNVTSVGRSSQIEYILTQRGEYALNTYSSIDNA